MTYPSAGDAVRDQIIDTSGAPVDAENTNFTTLTSEVLNPLVMPKDIDKNYKQFNGTFINASLKFTSNANYTTYVFRNPYKGFKITASAVKIFVAREMPTGTVGESLKVLATVTTSGTANTTYTMNYDKGAIIVLVWNTQGLLPDHPLLKCSSLIPYSEPRLMLTASQNEFNRYAIKDETIMTDTADNALGIIKNTGKILVTTSGNLSSNASYDTYSFQVPVDSMTIYCPNGYRACKSYFAPGEFNSNTNLIQLLYSDSSGRVDTFTAKYKEWVSISINVNSDPNGIILKTNLSHPFTMPGLRLSVGQSQAFYKYMQRTYQVGTHRYLYVCFKSGDKVIQYTLKNVPVASTNSNTWQLGYIKAYDFDGSDLSNEVAIVKDGEYEIAFKEHGAADYCGGNNHGDESTDVFKLFIDGREITDLTALDENYHTFNRIDAFEIATINRCDTPADKLIKHQKRWTFENGKVKVNETIETLVALSVDGMLCCMFPALRSAYKYGIRQGRTAIEDLTTSTYEKVGTNKNSISYFMYGDNVTAKITSKLCDHSPTAMMWINPTADLNKLYYGFWGWTDAAHPVSIPQGTVAWWENEYDVAYSAEDSASE